MRGLRACLGRLHLQGRPVTCADVWSRHMTGYNRTSYSHQQHKSAEERSACR